jgi:hypothetical protein
MVALEILAYVLSIQQGLENKVEKKKIYKINRLDWQFLMLDKGFQSSKLKFGL